MCECWFKRFPYKRSSCDSKQQDLRGKKNRFIWQSQLTSFTVYINDSGNNFHTRAIIGESDNIVSKKYFLEITEIRLTFYSFQNNIYGFMLLLFNINPWSRSRNLNAVYVYSWGCHIRNHNKESWKTLEPLVFRAADLGVAELKTAVASAMNLTVNIVVASAYKVAEFFCKRQ